MRRSRGSLTAWPAFADLMTILAVVGLAIASLALGSRQPHPGPTEIEELRRKLDDANERIAEQQAEIKRLQFDVIFRNGRPCLWDPGPPVQVVPLLQIVVASEYSVKPLWPPEYETSIAGIPRLFDAISRGALGIEEFQRFARTIYEYGDRTDTFEDSCRFYVELKQGGVDDSAFSRAYGIVTQYFLVSNAGEVTRILIGEQ